MVCDIFHLLLYFLQVQNEIGENSFVLMCADIESSFEKPDDFLDESIFLNLNANLHANLHANSHAKVVYVQILMNVKWV